MFHLIVFKLNLFYKGTKENQLKMIKEKRKNNSSV